MKAQTNRQNKHYFEFCKCDKCLPYIKYLHTPSMNRQHHLLQFLYIDRYPSPLLLPTFLCLNILFVNRKPDSLPRGLILTMFHISEQEIRNLQIGSLKLPKLFKSPKDRHVYLRFIFKLAAHSRLRPHTRYNSFIMLNLP